MCLIPKIDICTVYRLIDFKNYQLSFSLAFVLDPVQAFSQTCVAGVAKLSWKNHVVQNPRVCVVFYVITIIY